MRFLKDSREGSGDQPRSHLTQQEFVEAFKSSAKGKKLMESLEVPVDEKVSTVPRDPQFEHKFANPWYISLWLVTKHEHLVWRRNKQQV